MGFAGIEFRMAMHESRGEVSGAYPEARYSASNSERSKESQKKLLPVAFASMGVALIGGVLAWLWKKSR